MDGVVEWRVVWLDGGRCGWVVVSVVGWWTVWLDGGWVN